MDFHYFEEICYCFIIIIVTNFMLFSSSQILEDTINLNSSQTNRFPIKEDIIESGFDIDNFSLASSNYDK